MHSIKKNFFAFFTVFIFVLWAVFMFMNKSNETKVDEYSGETEIIIGKVVRATYAGRTDFFEEYNNFIVLDKGLNFHLRSKNIEMFCKGDILKITYPKVYSQESRFITAISYQVQSKGACGQIEVKDSRLSK